MGAKLLLLAPQAPTVAVSAYVDVLRLVQYLDELSHSRFLKTIRARDRRGTLVVVKVFIKPQGAALALRDVTELLAREASLMAEVPGVLPWSRVIETDRAGYLVRQHCKTNLYDRLLLPPFLQPVEKLFLVYQMLCTLRDVHRLRIHHGDLRLENFLVTSWNWLVLADFAAYTKPTFIPEDNPNQFLFYFDLLDRRVCYLAPERFYDLRGPHPRQSLSDEGRFGGRDLVTDAMDCFSLGCVVAELYLDGEPLFTLSLLLRYIRHDAPEAPAAAAPPPISAMVARLVERDPARRPLCAALLEDHTALFAPLAAVHAFLARLADASAFAGDATVTASDLRVDHIHSHFEQLVQCLGFDYEARGGGGAAAVPLRVLLPGVPHGHRIRSTNEVDTLGAAIVVLNAVCAFVKTTRRPASKLRACHLLLALSEYVDDEAKLDRLLPYLMYMAEEYVEAAAAGAATASAAAVAAMALRAATTLLLACSSVTPLNTLVFSEYIVPKLAALLAAPAAAAADHELVRAAVACCLPLLATCAKRFWLFADAAAPAAPDDMRDQLDYDLESLALTLLTDPCATVKQHLVLHIAPLCRALGVDRTNDLVLPHLITFLNDPNTALRLALFGALLELAPFIGAVAFEQYVLPLVVQTLCDPELFVVLKALELLHGVVAQRLVNPRLDSNALAVYHEILASCLHLVLHPNEWVRQLVLCVVLAVSAALTNADRYCFLFPRIKTFLAYDVAEFSWDSLYPSLTKPLSRPVFELAVAWCASATDRSLFWRDAKGAGLPPPGARAPSAFTAAKPATVPLSPEDKQWLFKLKAIGLEHRHLWKVYVLRDFVYRYSRAKPTAPPLPPAAALAPRNVFCEIAYKSEPLAPTAHKTHYEAAAAPAATAAPAPGRVRASVQTVQATVFAELDSGLQHAPKQARRAPSATRRVFGANNGQVITATVRHSYAGTNPYIDAYLNALEFSPTFDCLAEFGAVVRAPAATAPPRFRTCAAQVDPGTLDSINALALCDNGEYFVTGSESGALRVWDTLQLAKNAMARSASLRVALGAAVSCVRFLPRRHVFAVATDDGLVRLYRVDFTRGTSRKAVKYTRLSQIRHYRCPPGTHVTALEFGGNTLVAVTLAAVVVLDIVKMQPRCELATPLAYGTPLTFVVDPKCCWLLLGTSRGCLCLFDLRFEALLRSWRVRTESAALARRPRLPIRQLVPADTNVTAFAMIGGTGESDVTVWDIPSLSCKQVLSLQVASPSVKLYGLEEAQADDVALVLLEVDLEPPQEGMTFLGGAAGSVLVSATADCRIIVWDPQHVERCAALNYDRPVHFTKSVVNLGLCMFNERDGPEAGRAGQAGHETSRNSSGSMLPLGQDQGLVRHRDVVTGVVMAPGALISTDRRGCVHLYQ